MIRTLIRLPFGLLKLTAGVIVKLFSLVFSTFFGLLRLIFGRLFGSLFGAVIGLLLGKRHLGIRLFSRPKKKKN